MLDFGCGTGIWAMELSDKHPGAPLIAIDLSPVSLAMSDVTVLDVKLHAVVLRRLLTYPLHIYRFNRNGQARSIQTCVHIDERTW